MRVGHDQNAPAFLYVIASDGLIKIGIAADSKVRMAHLQLASPTELRLHHERPFATRVAARNAERSIHLRFASARKWGEWFELHPDEAKAAVDGAADMEAPVTIPTGPRWPSVTFVPSPKPQRTAPVLRPQRDGPTFDELEAMPDHIWTEFMVPCSIALEFTLSDDERQARMDAADAALRAKYPQYFAREPA